MLIRDRYRLETVLGQGGMGQVWRAHDALLDRPVAVKLLDSRAADETAAARFTLEARTAGRLSHPHVVAVHDFGAVDDRLYLVMELVEGSSLAAVIATAGRLDAHDVGVWGGQAASALAAAHRERIVHRDIKPSNLLVTADGMIKVGDFGIARFASEASAGMTRTGMIIGTAAYLAPERALGRASGPPSDMYALGCVLYELLAGSPPFRADTSAALLHQHVQALPADLRHDRPDIPDALAELIGRLLDKEPSRRPTADQVAARLADSSAVTSPSATVYPMNPAADPAHETRAMPPLSGASAYATAAHPPAVTPSKRNLLIGIAAAVVLAAAGIAAAATGGSSAPRPAATTPATTPAPVAPASPAVTTTPAPGPKDHDGGHGRKPAKGHHHG